MTPPAPGSFASRVEAGQLVQIGRLMDRVRHRELSGQQHRLAHGIATDVVLGRYVAPKTWAEMQTYLHDRSERCGCRMMEAFQVVIALEMAEVIPPLESGTLTTSDPSEIRAQLGAAVGKAVRHG